MLLSDNELSCALQGVTSDDLESMDESWAMGMKRMKYATTIRWRWDTAAVTATSRWLVKDVSIKQLTRYLLQQYQYDQPGNK